MTIPVAQLAWMAGVIDLKGKLIWKANQTRAPGSKQVTLYVESIQKPIVDRLASLTGTSPELKKQRSRFDGWFRKGCDEHCPDQHVHVNPGEFLPAARWTVSGAAMAVVVTGLAPYMVQDKGLTEAAAYAFEHMTLWGQGAGTTVAALRRLHGLGWVLPDIILANRPTIVSSQLAKVPENMELMT